jgi:hypothetical protein
MTGGGETGEAKKEAIHADAEGDGQKEDLLAVLQVFEEIAGRNLAEAEVDDAILRMGDGEATVGVAAEKVSF